MRYAYTMYNKIVSSIKNYPTSNLVYSSMSAFAHLGNGELPGTWFVRALTELGHSPNAIRQTLFRLTKQGELEAHKLGRQKFYSSSNYMRKEISVGLEKIFMPPSQTWDGLWTMVQYSFEGEERNDRERLRSILNLIGFAPLGTGLYVHPQDHSQAIADVVQENDLTGSVRIFRSRQLSGENDRRLVKDLWNLTELARQFRTFQVNAQKIEPLISSANNQQAFQMRYFVVMEILRIAWSDPDLPISLLPASWPGYKARAAAKSLYQRLLDPATEHAREILERSQHTEKEKSRRTV